MKAGTVALIGRPNTGKSTLVNNLVGQKVAITSPKPQTTQFLLYAVYEDERGQIIFVDTPGIFAKTKNIKSRELNLEAEKALGAEVNALLYIIDHTRPRGIEENRVLGIVRKVNIPKILIYNKWDVKTPSYFEQYRFLEDEFNTVIYISALKAHNLLKVIDVLFEYLPEGERAVIREDLAVPALNLTSKTYIEEAIREKAFLKLRDEVPYAVQTVVDEMYERKNGVLYIKARLLTPPRYKKMIIGKNASRIKEISRMARRDLEISSGRKIFLELTVDAT